MKPSHPQSGPIDVHTSRFASHQMLGTPATLAPDSFWGRRQRTNREISLPHGLSMLHEHGTLANFAAVATRQGTFRGQWPFMDSDPYKWLEAVAFELARSDDPTLRQGADHAIDLIAAAQDDSGYLNTFYQLQPRLTRWGNLRGDHELYCAGHLIQAAVAWHRCCNDDRLLRVAMRFVSHIHDLFGPHKRDGYCGHPEIETALIELARLTGDHDCRTLAGLMIDRRGRGLLHADTQDWKIGGAVYFQDHAPVRDCREVAGHAVRQLYLNAGVTDLYLDGGDPALLAAMTAQFSDMTARKMYLTGGLGARPHNESFGDAFELPNQTAYCETCAQIAAVFWAQRMLLATGQPDYADAIELWLFNSVPSGMSIDGRSYFYANPQMSRGEKHRTPWFGCACCPPNLMRLIASLGHYVATASDDALHIHQYLPGLIRHGPTSLELHTNFPYDGQFRLTVHEAAIGRVHLRIPRWCHNATLTRSHRPVERSARGFIIPHPIAGEVLTGEFPMPPRWAHADANVESTVDRVALTRGPMVYCTEALPTDADLTHLKVDPAHTPPIEPSSLHTEPTLIARLCPGTSTLPYCLWAHTPARAMRVWLRQK